ncbi:hypothetical protein CHS0354_032361 [Potamilus streckersoni]|uniref:F-box domain-containing protein n=1 Tax=Potamilus streckersoni TaxID=2493646 RepID=A0AAE0TGN3_9BIVA|nr:hypothetical protein CHS0354_032361 [Potamilus streckersoni]
MASRHRHQLRQYLDTHKNRKSSPEASSPGSSSRSSRAVDYLSRRKVPTKIVGRASINDLPDEILLKIFGYLDAQGLLTAGQICQRWKALANDNFLWNKICERFAAIPTVSRQQQQQQQEARGERLPASHWKKMCLKKCEEERNKRAFKLLGKVNPYSGIPKNAEKAIKSAGISFQLSMVDRQGKENPLYSRDIFYHCMCLSVRWYDLQVLPLKEICNVKIFSCNPLFFMSDGRPYSNSPYQRSLLMSFDLKWEDYKRTAAPIGADDMVDLYSLPQGLLVAVWKADSELAFVSVGLHLNGLLQKCLKGNPTEIYTVPAHKIRPDDIDSKYGLHDYSCTIEFRTMRQSIWHYQFRNLYCKADKMGPGFAEFPIIRRDVPSDHAMLPKKLNFPWKTEAFKGTVENGIWLDVTVMDEKKEIFWHKSSAVKITSQMMQSNLNFEFTNQEIFHITCADDKGKIYMEMSQNDQKEFFIIVLDLMLSLVAVNDWFGTKYS